MELRCENGILFGHTDCVNNTIDVACKSARCGKRPGVVVIHTIDLASGEVLSTKLYQELTRPKRKVTNDSA